WQRKPAGPSAGSRSRGWFDHMVRNIGIVCLLAAFVAIGGGCRKSGAPAERAGVPIVEKNVAARGGLRAWRGVATMSMSGSMDAGKVKDPAAPAMAMQRSAGRAPAERRQAAPEGGKEDTGKMVQVPFVMEMERPR